MDQALADAVANHQPVSIFLEASVPIQHGVDALDWLKAMGISTVSLVPEASNAVQ